MGYHVNLQFSSIFIPAQNLPAAFVRLCELNGPEYDHQKRGFSSYSGNIEYRYYSWMSEHYDKECKDAKEIFEHLGFECEVDESGNLQFINYDSKTGQELLFFEHICDLMSNGVMSWLGEDEAEFFWGNNTVELREFSTESEAREYILSSQQREMLDASIDKPSDTVAKETHKI